MSYFREGDVVRWRSECVACDEELSDLYVVSEPASDGRCFIRPVSRLPFPGIMPTFLADMSMLELMK